MWTAAQPVAPIANSITCTTRSRGFSFRRRLKIVAQQLQVGRIDSVEGNKTIHKCSP